MNAFTALEDFITEGRAYKILVITSHKTQVSQATSRLEAQPKTIFDIGCDHLAPSKIFQKKILNLIQIQRHALQSGQSRNQGQK
jgi:hypothetical protein